VVLSAAGMPKVVPVLVYHHIQPETTSDVSCTPEQFESQMQAILAAGFTPLSLEQMARFLKGSLPESIEKPVLITFDDGYESLYFYALPVARKLKIPMTVFVVTSRIGRRPQFADYLREEQIREMSASGFWEFGSHTHDLHTDSIRIFDAFGPVRNNPVLELLSRDLRASVNRLESIIGKKPGAIAWPYGKFNAHFTQIARDCGFKLHFTSCSGYNEAGANPFAIKRLPVSSRDNAFSVLKKVSRIR
jgi:peptidoglycan/xylan/chitin deacetylase (PgdA/CDA1 family)